MKISIITVGKLKEKYLKQGIAEYTKRLSEADMTIVKQKEGERILAK